tara:strand:+ start:6005 stop:7786 length:1782 start_codon:yes stop_codon:yes gene_type:complete
VISGFVIARKLESEKGSPLLKTLKNFYIGRVIRLVPSLTIVSIVTSVLIAALWHEPSEFLKTIVFAQIGLSNIYMLILSRDYFSAFAGMNPFTHTWSLGVEEQFYFVFPFFVIAGHLFSTKGYVNFLLLTITVGSFALFAGEQNHSIFFFSPMHRAWEILVGVMIARSELSIKGFPCVLVKSVILQALLLVFLGVTLWGGLGAFVPTKMEHFFVVILTAMLILVGVTNPRANTNKFFAFTLLAYVGAFSYTLYLVHWPTIILAKYLVNIEENVFILVFFAFLISVIIYHFVEEPIRSAHRMGKSWALTVTGSGFLVSISATIALGYGVLSPPLAKDFLLGKPTVQMDLEKRFGSRTSYVSSGVGRDLILVGDSHATNLVASLDNAFPERLKMFNGSIPLLRHLNADAADQVTPSDLLGIKLVDMVSNKIIFSISRSRLYEPVGYRLSPSERRDLVSQNIAERLEQFLLDLSRVTEDKEAEIILVDDIPYTCGWLEIMRWSRSSVIDCFVDKNKSDLDRRPLTKILMSVADRFPHVFYLDPQNFLCSEQTCITETESGPIYADQSPHFSAANRTLLAPFFFEELKGWKPNKNVQ